MSTVYKRDKSDKKSRWYIAWFDHTGKRRFKCSGTTDKSAAIRIANKLESEVALRRENVINPKLDELSQMAAKPLKVHLDDYSASLSAKRRSENHIDSTRSTIERIAEQVGISSLGTIDADKVNRYAATMHAEGKAARTIASHLQAIKGFTKWAVRSGKLASDPLATVSKPSVEDDRRLVRRFLSHDEWNWLDSITRQSAERFGMTGLERALLYATAIQTGLRSNELRSLTRGKLHLTGETPFILADAARTKNGKPARQYIQPELAAEFSQRTGKKLGGAVVFSMPSKFDVADMLRADLDAARSAWLDTFQNAQERIERDASDFLRSIDSEAARIDFHALRHTTASWLIRSGADIKTVQTIMRHSDIKLTLDRYGHLFPGAESDAVSRMRSAFTQQPKRATGTSDKTACQHSRQQLGRVAVRNLAKPDNKSVVIPPGDSREPTFAKPTNSAEKQGFEGSRPSRTRTCDLRIRNPLLYPTEL